MHLTQAELAPLSTLASVQVFKVLEVLRSRTKGGSLRCGFYLGLMDRTLWYPLAGISWCALALVPL